MKNKIRNLLCLLSIILLVTGCKLSNNEVSSSEISSSESTSKEDAFYSFSFSGTNCTCLHEAKYAINETVNLRIIPNENYFLSETIEVIGSSQYQYDHTDGTFRIVITENTVINVVADSINDFTTISFDGFNCSCQTLERYKRIK